MINRPSNLLKTIKTMKTKLILASLLSLGVLTTSAQEIKKEATSAMSMEESVQQGKSWEIGLGGSLFNWSRIDMTNFEATENSYHYSMKTRPVFGGVNLYVARELNEWFYLDLQASAGSINLLEALKDKEQKLGMMVLAGPGVQFRLSPLFKNRWVEPYLRLGINYLWRNFEDKMTGGFDNDITKEGKWAINDLWSKAQTEKGKVCQKRAKRSYSIPVSFGIGVNTWLSDHFGLGLQGEYLMPIRRGERHFAHLSGRLLWRWGGASKFPKPVVQYVEVEKPVEKIVERIVEKVVEVPTAPEMCDLMDNIYFAFDKAGLEHPASKASLDKLAVILKNHPNDRFLITGYTDARGSHAYNLILSRKRAKQVYDALIEKGVPAGMLKWRGVSKRTAIAPSNAKDSAREGDRKVLIERITNLEYWDAIRSYK